MTLRGAGWLCGSGLKALPCHADARPTAAGPARPARGLLGPPPTGGTLTPRCLQAWPGPRRRKACPSSPGDFPQHVLTLLRLMSCALSGTILPDAGPHGIWCGVGSGPGDHASTSKRPWRQHACDRLSRCPNVSGRVYLSFPAAGLELSLPGSAPSPLVPLLSTSRFLWFPSYSQSILKNLHLCLEMLKRPPSFCEFREEKTANIHSCPEPVLPVSVKCPACCHQDNRNHHVNMTHKP